MVTWVVEEAMPADGGTVGQVWLAKEDRNRRVGGAAARGEEREEGRRRGWCGELLGRFFELEEEVSAGSRVVN